MMRYLLIMMVLALCVRLSNAQAPAQLIAPTIDDYLAAIPSIVTDGFSSSLANIIDFEVQLRYDPVDATFDTLYNAYDAIEIQSFPYGFTEQRLRWNHWLLLKWIEENNIDLKITQEIAYKDYTGVVEPRDFDNDSQPEWLLKIYSRRFSQFVVLDTNDDNLGLVETPIRYFFQGGMTSSIQSGFMAELLFQDLNQDRLPEWVLATGGFGSNNLSSGYLQVLQWQDGSLVELGTEGYSINTMYYSSPAGGGYPPLFPYGVTVTFDDDDTNGTTDILIQQLQGDNWACTWTLERVFSWEGAQYSLARMTRTEDKVRGCEIRRAEEAMWQQDYETAITHYERAFQLTGIDEYFVDEFGLDRYAMTRLALAYTQVGRNADAAALINSIEIIPDELGLVPNLIVAIKDNLGNSTAMCQAAYDVFDYECSGDGCLGSPIGTIVGYTVDNLAEQPNSPRLGRPSPLYAGCNIEPPKPPMTATPIPTQIAPASTPTPNYATEPYYTMFDAKTAIQNFNFQRAIEILEVGLTNPSLEPDSQLAMQYMIALSLEFSGQGDKALAQYQSIMASSSEGWTRLAALHVEQTP